MTPQAALADLATLSNSIPIAYTPGGIWFVYADRHTIEDARAMIHAAQDAGHTLTRAAVAILTGQPV